jgi:hypothetical protein
MSDSHIQTSSELEVHFSEQLDFIQSSAESYDSGRTSEAKRIALAIRVLVHDTKRSKSLLTQLNKKTALFLDTAEPFDSDSVMTFSGLILMHISADSKPIYQPLLDDFVKKELVCKEFDAWWDAIVFVDSQKRSLSRKDLVLSVADKDGGAHVDPQLNSVYADLSRKNSLGGLFSLNGGVDVQPMDGAERAAIRQIGHEVLKTFLPGYGKSSNAEGMMVAGLKMLVGEAATRRGKELRSLNPAHNGGCQQPLRSVKIGRNEICPCGVGGKKYKHCCGSVA